MKHPVGLLVRILALIAVPVCLSPGGEEAPLPEEEELEYTVQIRFVAASELCQAMPVSTYPAMS